MANLLLEFNGVTTYSDGVHLPSEEVGLMDNRIIKQSIACDSEDLIAKAAIDTAISVFPEELNELQKLNSGFIVVSDSEWVTVVRDRNIIRFVFDINHDTSERVASIIFKHNTEKEVYCEVSITQYGEVYGLTVDRNEILFGENAGYETVNVTCVGGTSQYFIHKIRKYSVHTYGDNVEITKQVAFDNAISTSLGVEGNSQLIIGSNGSLVLDNSYYEVTIEHADLIGLTQTIYVRFPQYKAIDEIPEDPYSNGIQCPEESLLSVNIASHPNEELVDPQIIIDDRDTDIVIDSLNYSYEINVMTVPQESQIYFIYYGGFIDDYLITDYIDGNGNISHGLKIKAKPNPYGFGRNCIGYVINAMYPQVRKQVSIHQDGHT